MRKEAKARELKIPDVEFTMIQEVKETKTDLKYKTQVHAVYKHSYEIHCLYRHTQKLTDDITLSVSKN